MGTNTWKHGRIMQADKDNARTIPIHRVGSTSNFIPPTSFMTKEKLLTIVVVRYTQAYEHILDVMALLVGYNSCICCQFCFLRSFLVSITCNGTRTEAYSNANRFPSFLMLKIRLLDRLPFSLVESSGWITIAIVSIASYGIIGIVTKAAELEDPFGTGMFPFLRCFHSFLE